VKLLVPILTAQHPLYSPHVQTQVEVLDDDALFAGEDDEEDESAFVMGGFSDSLGDDFLGLRELGIAAELGLSSLTIPKKLLKGKSRGAAGAAIEYVLSIQSLYFSFNSISLSEQNPKNRHPHIRHRLRYFLSRARMWAIRSGYYVPTFKCGLQHSHLPARSKVSLISHLALNSAYLLLLAFHHYLMYQVRQASSHASSRSKTMHLHLRRRNLDLWVRYSRQALLQGLSRRRTKQRSQY
jgi:hypothetical protein